VTGTTFRMLRTLVDKCDDVGRAAVVRLVNAIAAIADVEAHHRAGGGWRRRRGRVRRVRRPRDVAMRAVPRSARRRLRRRRRRAAGAMARAGRARAVAAVARRLLLHRASRMREGEAVGSCVGGDPARDRGGWGDARLAQGVGADTAGARALARIAGSDLNI
jgi:hypothetical protein